MTRNQFCKSAQNKTCNSKNYEFIRSIFVYFHIENLRFKLPLLHFQPKKNYE